ncbi:MFS transporter [Streptomyces sp. CT34]|uniref:MFS transporter n=1 Tax=Streptomyces sp. CT34 TaxID=1553907 RepID=UPI000A5A1D92|nr:MFS transporter [Streptomyces sp. CT34]
MCPAPAAAGVQSNAALVRRNADAAPRDAGEPPRDADADAVRSAADAPPPDADAAGGGAADPRRWLILAIASATQFLAVLDLIAVTIAFPAIGRDFAPAPASALSWVLNGYTVVLAALLVPAGRLADEAGRRRCFLTGMVLFGLASAACGMAPTLTLLIVARVVQGVAAAVLIPTSLSLALPAFPPRERATAVGAWTAVSAVAASSGPVIGGLLAASDWRLIFLINVPVVLLAVGAGVRLLPRSERGGRQALDLPGTALVLVCVGALVTACVEAPEWGYTSPATLAVLAAGVLVGALGVRHVRRAADPVVHPELFRTPGFAAATLGLLSYFVAYGAMMLGASLLFTDVWHYSVRTAGLALAPWPLTVLVVSALSGRVVGAVGARATGVIGALCFVAATLWWLALAGDGQGGGGTHYATHFLPGLIFAGFGTGLYQPVMFAATGLLPSRQLSLGSGVLMVSRQAGTALGVAVLVAVTGGRQQPDFGSLRGGWIIAAVTSAGAVAAALTLRRGGARVSGEADDR